MAPAPRSSNPFPLRQISRTVQSESVFALPLLLWAVSWMKGKRHLLCRYPSEEKRKRNQKYYINQATAKINSLWRCQHLHPSKATSACGFCPDHLQKQIHMHAAKKLLFQSGTTEGSHDQPTRRMETHKGYIGLSMAQTTKWNDKRQN